MNPAKSAVKQELPIEQWLFSEISRNCTGKPLASCETVINCIRTTKTSTGLTAEAELMKNMYQKGERVPDRELESDLTRKIHEFSG